MMTIIKRGQGLLYMKVGKHAQEPLEAIIARKRKEIEDAGYALWGYGGNTCHPMSMVQPFVRDFQRRGGVIYLCMEKMDSQNVAPQSRADEFSVDGIRWEKIPLPIKVVGSRYALAIKNLHSEDFRISLEKTRVAIGRSMGKPGNKYIAGRVDKACLECTEDMPAEPEESSGVHIDLVAEIVDPYAVFVRNLT